MSDQEKELHISWCKGFNSVLPEVPYPPENLIKTSIGFCDNNEDAELAGRSFARVWLEMEMSNETF